MCMVGLECIRCTVEVENARGDMLCEVCVWGGGCVCRGCIGLGHARHVGVEMCVCAGK